LFDLDDVEHPGIDLVICGVDNNTARRAVSAWAYRHNIPAIIAGFAIDSSSGYVMTQVPSETCWLCMFPQFENDGSYPCALPSTGDIVAITTGWMGYAADTFVGTRGREWNLKTFYLDGALPDRTVTILPRPSCPICDRQPTTLAA